MGQSLRELNPVDSAGTTARIGTGWSQFTLAELALAVVICGLAFAVFLSAEGSDLLGLLLLGTAAILAFVCFAGNGNKTLRARKGCGRRLAPHEMTMHRATCPICGRRRRSRQKRLRAHKFTFRGLVLLALLFFFASVVPGVSSFRKPPNRSRVITRITAISGTLLTLGAAVVVGACCCPQGRKENTRCDCCGGRIFVQSGGGPPEFRGHEASRDTIRDSDDSGTEAVEGV
jgi:hypothetical protein